MGIRISELPEATTLSLSADYFPFVQDGVTKKVLMEKLGTSAVTSVNGETGDVVLDLSEPLAQDIIAGNQVAASASFADTAGNGGVTSVNGETGDVVIDVSVTSVNGETGDVVIPVTTTTVFIQAMTESGKLDIQSADGDVFIRLTGSVDIYTVFLPDPTAGRKAYLFCSGSVSDTGFSISGGSVGLVYPNIDTLTGNAHYTLIGDGSNWYQV